MARSTVAVKFTGDVSALKKSAGDAEGVLGGFASKAGGILKSGLMAAGVIGAAALAKGFSDALGQENATDKAAASLGLSPEESKELGKVAGKLYADAYGESFGQVADAVASVKSALGDLSDADLEDVTANALDFAKAFDQDVNASIGAAGLLLTNGLVADGKEAFDLLTATMQDVPQAARDEVLAATEEYSTFFADLGLSGQEAFGAIAQAAEKGGRFGVDKLGDALKELGIRATDMSAASVAAYESAGLSAREMSWKLLQGGDTARDAFYEIVTGLRGIEGPIEQSKAAIALFGTPLEDLSTAEIPEFLASLDNMGDALGDVEGAADDMGNTLNDNTATKIEAFKRKGLQVLADFIGERVIPAIETLATWFNDKVKPAMERVAARIREDLQPALDELAIVWREELQPALEESWAYFEENILPILGDLTVFIVGTVIPILVQLYLAFHNTALRSGEALGRLAALVGKLDAVIQWAVSSIRAALDRLSEKFPGISGAAATMSAHIRGSFQSIITFVSGAAGAVGGILSGLAEAMYTVGGRIVKRLVEGMRNAAGQAAGAASHIARVIISRFPQSPVQEGPLTALNDGGPGRKIVEMLAGGMYSASSVMGSAADSVANAALPVLSGGGLAMQGAGAATVQPQVNITVQGSVYGDRRALMGEITQAVRDGIPLPRP